jgi:hypothetical protein
MWIGAFGQSVFLEAGHPLRRMAPEHNQGSRRSWRLILPLVVLVLMLSVCSCVDLTSVVQFAKSSQDVGNSFKLLVDDTLATCKGAHDFFPPGKTPLDCTQYESLEPKLTAINEVLFEYIASLGKLAGPISSTNPFENVGDELKNADPNITEADQTKAKAAGGLFSALSQVALNGYQQRRLTAIIRDTNPSVQNVVGFLSGYAADQSIETIRNTWTLENEFCVGQPQVHANEPLAIKLLGIKCEEDSAHKDAKLAAVKKYQDALQVIANTHAKLTDPKSWTTVELVKYLAPQIAELGSAAIAMRSAFL